MSRHTSGPWTVDGRCIQAPDGNIALLNLARSEDESGANAGLIVRAVNGYEDLLQALQRFIDLHDAEYLGPDPRAAHAVKLARSALINAGCVSDAR